jgi:uroporphyrinogen-III synthase
MKDKTVAILESRARDQIADLVRKHRGTPFVAPALAEISDVDPAHIRELIDDWNIAPPDISDECCCLIQIETWRLKTASRDRHP